MYKTAVLRLLSPELPLNIVVDRIDDEDYWRRRCELTLDMSKVVKCVLDAFGLDVAFKLMTRLAKSKGNKLFCSLSYFALDVFN